MSRELRRIRLNRKRSQPPTNMPSETAQSQAENGHIERAQPWKTWFKASDNPRKESQNFDEERTFKVQAAQCGNNRHSEYLVAAECAVIEKK